MDSVNYLLILAACLVATLPLELGLGARVYRRPWLVTRTLLPVVVVFLTWDLLAYARGHWWFDDRYILGPRLLGLPMEEWLFFVVVPLCALLTFEAVSNVLDRRATPAARRVEAARTRGRPEARHG